MKVLSRYIFYIAIIPAILIISYYLFPLVLYALNDNITNFDLEKVEFFIGIAKDIIHILFFVGILTLTILSYLQAKKSLFTPLKTETFKLQIKAFENIILFFQNKNQFAFMDEFDYYKILDINSELLVLNYSKLFFSLPIDGKYGDVISKTKGCIVINNKKINKSENTTSNKQLSKKEEWANMNYSIVHFTPKYSDRLNELKRLSATPLINQELKSMIIGFERKIEENLRLVGTVLTDIAKELPSNFSTLESVDKNNLLSKAWKNYIKLIGNIDDDAKKILEYINHYLKVEDVLK